jgi:hypothetical protein
MLEEAADEFRDFEGKNSWAFAVRFAIANEHGAVLDVGDARVGDCDFEDVGSKVFEASFAGGYRLGVNVPVDVPNFGGDLIEQLGLYHLITKLGPEDSRESFDGEEEVDSGGMPGAIGGTQSPTRNDVMDMGMIVQGSSPGVQDPEEAGEIGTDVLLIEGEFFDGVGGSLEQSGVSQALVLSHEVAQRFWDRKRNQERVSWELALDLFFEPLLGFMVLAGGAMAIAAGAIELARLSAAVTLVKRHPAGLRTTGDDGIDDFAVSAGHDRSIALKILGAEGGKDFTDGGHDRVPPSRD